MNILYIESSRSWGGQEYRTCLEINWLNAHDHQAWLVCDPQSEVLAKARELGTRTTAVPLRRRFDPIVWWRLWQLRRQARIDLIKAFSSKDHWLALPLYLLGIPLIRARCITDPIGNKSRAFIFKHGCSKVLADASVIKCQLVQENGISPEKIEVVGSAVDLEKFNPSRDRMKFRRELGLDTNTPLIANIGMMRPDKGQTLFVEAAQRVLEQRPDARFVIVGQGTGWLKLGAKVRLAISRAQLKERIFTVGYRWDTPDIFAAADMVVIASLRTEASPIVLREAFASGRPVVATKVGDVPEIIQNEQNGLMVEPGDSGALAAAILRFLSEPNLAAQCAAAGLRYAREHFSFDRMMESKTKIDAALVTSPAASPSTLAHQTAAELISSKR
jgi:glycosyltransferase involved in cell wall biosynthesis